MRRFTMGLVLVAATILGSCRDQDITSPDGLTPSFAIVDAAHGGENPDFFWLPPLVPNPSDHPDFEEDEFNPNLRPVVEICALTLDDLDKNGNPTEQTPCADNDAQPEGFPIVYTMGEGPGSETVKVTSAHYAVNWHTDQFELDLSLFYRIHVRVGATLLGLADVQPLNNGRELRNLKTDDVIGLVDGRTLPVRFRIESGALCDPPGTKPCASSTFDLEEGGTVILEETGDRVDIPAQATLPAGVTEVTVTVQLCEEGINVDLPTFGNCLEITSDPVLDETTDDKDETWSGLFPRAVISMCSLTDSSELPDGQQHHLVTLHRQNDQGEVQALPHAEGFCEAPQEASLWSGGFRGFALRGFDRVRDGLSWLGSPRALLARARAPRLDIGHAGESPFLSKFQFALPAQMEVVAETNNQTAAAGGPVPLGPAVFVSDRGGNPVSGATVRFQVVDDAGSVAPATVVSDDLGIARVEHWHLGNAAGTYQLLAQGRGIAGAGDEGPFMPELGPSTGDQVPVPVTTGVVTFTAAVCESEPCAVGTINLNEGGFVVLQETGDRVDIPGQDEETLPDGVTEVTITLELCDGIDVHLPTYGNCLRITSDPELTEVNFEGWGGLSDPAIVSMCSVVLEGDPVLDALDQDQRKLVTLHRERDDGFVQALPHADDNCPPAPPQIESAWSGGEGRLARRGFESLRRGLAHLVGPKSLHAGARPTRLDVGHAGESPFLSNFQLALPAKMVIVSSPEGAIGDAGSALRSPAVDILVVDRDDQPVTGARVRFDVTAGGGSISHQEIITEKGGRAGVGWTLGEAAGANTLRLSAKGIAGPGEAPFMPDLASETEDPQNPVMLGFTEVFFEALGLGLVSKWTGDGTFQDAMGQNPAEAHGNVDFVEGIVGQAFSFDGQGSWAGAPGKNIDDADHISILGWVRMDSEAPVNRIERFVTLTGEKAVLRHDGETSSGQFHFFTSIGGELRHIRVDDVLRTGCFQHFAGTYDGSVMRAYLDGVEVGALEVSGLLDAGEGVELSSGAASEAGPETLHGLLDEIEVHNRALDPEEIQARYDAGDEEKKCASEPTGPLFGQVVTPGAAGSPIVGVSGMSVRLERCEGELDASGRCQLITQPRIKPRITDELGRFSAEVPEGTWQIRPEPGAAGYPGISPVLRTVEVPMVDEKGVGAQFTALIIDQDQPVIDIQSSIGIFPDQRLAQTVTTGDFTEVSFVSQVVVMQLDLPVWCDSGSTLSVVLTGVDQTGAPDDQALADESLFPASVIPRPPESVDTEFRRLVLTWPVIMEPGQPYAIVLGSDGSCALGARGPLGDSYAGGDAWVFSDASGWVPVSPMSGEELPRRDLPFRVLVR